MSLGGGDMLEVGHPSPPDQGDDPRQAGFPVLHLGPIAAGRGVALDDQLRQEFAYKNGVLCYDGELDRVVESVYGNRKDHYILIRGISDYKVSPITLHSNIYPTIFLSGWNTSKGMAALLCSDGCQCCQVHH